MEELEARGWSIDRLAIEMGGDFGINRLALDLWMAVQDPHCHLGDEMADQFAVAFGCSADLFKNLEAAWIASGPPCVLDCAHQEAPQEKDE